MRTIRINKYSCQAIEHRTLWVGFGLALATMACSASSLETPAEQQEIDFDSALRGLKFDPKTLDGANHGAGNGILDADEMALVAAVLNDKSIDLSDSGGVSHNKAIEAFSAAKSVALSDFSSVQKVWPTAATVGIGYAMLGTDSLQSYSAMVASFGVIMDEEGYKKATKLGKYFARDGDADGDGVSNIAEYLANIPYGRSAYLSAALDPSKKEGKDLSPSPMEPIKKKVLGVVLYPGFELLDVFGPLEMWAYVPNFQVITIAEKAGPIASAQQGIEAVAQYSFQSAPKLDIVMIPGGVGTIGQLENEQLLQFLNKVDKDTELTTSVCTGSALLARAGLLKGRRATSNKSFFSLATDQDASVDWQRSARWVEDGKYMTSSGVSAGIDMALAIIAKYEGKEHAKHLAEAVEYVWNDDPDNDPFALDD